MMEQTLFYKAQTTGIMWDTWLYWYEDVYYLYYIVGRSENDAIYFTGIGMATSADGVHWREIGLVLEMADGVTMLGTGSVWAVPTHDGAPRFIMNFSEMRDNAQSIFFAESTDLLHWQRLGSEYEFRPDASWYHTEGGWGSRWDCINTIERPDGGRYGYWTANPQDFVGFGFGETDDGVTWRALPPPRIEWGEVEPLPSPGIEHGSVAEIGGRYYTMLGSGPPYGPYNCGMFAFVADDPAGSFRPAPVNFALLTTPLGEMYTYFARFFPLNGELLVNHHAHGWNGVYFAPLKLAEVDDAGTLRFKWWPGNSAALQDWMVRTIAGTQLAEEIPYDPSSTILLEATVRIPAHPQDEQPELRVSCGSDQQAARFLMGPRGVVNIELVEPDGSAHWSEQVDRSLALSGMVALRVLIMHYFVELYLDDYLIQCYALRAKPAGRLTISGTVEHVEFREVGGSTTL